MTKERRNPAPAWEKRTVVERGYFHTGNSGITISMIEESQNHDWDDENRSWYNHHLEIRHSAFGAGSSFRTPIAGPAMCQYYIDAFTRLRDRMVNDPDYGIPYPFESYRYEDVPTVHRHPKKGKGRSSATYRIEDIVDGLKREEVWSEELVVSEWSTDSHLLGHNFIDEDGHVVRFEPYLDGGPCSRGSDSCHDGLYPPYRKEDIGKPVSKVTLIRYDEEDAPVEPEE